VLPPMLPCRDNWGFQIVITSSKGQVSKVPLALQCRKRSQSFLISFLDHDHSIAQAAIILPMEVHSPEDAERLHTVGMNPPPRNARGSRSYLPKQPNPTIVPPIDDDLDELLAYGYPVLLSLHGSGITAQSHADAYKIMLPGNTEYTFGIQHYYLIAPTRFGAHNWETTGYLTARSSLFAMEKIASQYPDILPKLRITESILSGHSMGGHGAWVMSVNIPNHFICINSNAGWIKKEEYGNSNALFGFDISSSYIEPRLKEIIEKSLHEFHVDKLISNLYQSIVHIRVGSHDLTTHPWYSRRMHRLLLEHGVNSTLEEPFAKQHWWWDSQQANDGGVLNDDKMRSFYTKCYSKYMQQVTLWQEKAKYDAQLVTNHSNTNMSTISDFSDWLLSSLNKDILSSRKCADFALLTVINPALHSGYCGLTVLQQIQVLSLSTITATMNKKFKTCHLQTGNVRRFKLDSGFDNVCYNAIRLRVNGNKLIDSDLPINESGLEICISTSRQAHLCLNHTVSMLEKVLVNYGPIRHVSHHPFYIIYGTPNDQRLRLTIRDYAIYLANAYYAAHHTYVAVFSDLEFRADSLNSQLKSHMANLIFIGDIHTNKLLKLIHKASEHGNKKHNAAIQFRLPGEIQMHGYRDYDVDDNAEQGDDDVVKTTNGFTINNITFDQPDHAMIFTLPIQRIASPGSTTALALGVCITANTVQGFYHLSRLAWPVIPPMVRAPFSAYMPDYVVIGQDIWSKGPGGILAAGYWDARWQYDSQQAYLAHTYI
jgi:hypothetical protein